MRGSLRGTFRRGPGPCAGALDARGVDAARGRAWPSARPSVRPRRSRLLPAAERRARSHAAHRRRTSGDARGSAHRRMGSALVHGVDNLDGRDDHSYRSLPVPVLLPPRQRRDSTEAISYQQSSRRVRGVVVDGIPVTQRLRTALDLSRSAPDVTEALVPLDAFLGHRLLTPEHLQLGVERWGGRRGIRQVRAAVGSARVTAIVSSTARTTSERNAWSVPGWWWSGSTSSTSLAFAPGWLTGSSALTPTAGPATDRVIAGLWMSRTTGSGFPPDHEKERAHPDRRLQLR